MNNIRKIIIQCFQCFHIGIIFLIASVSAWQSHISFNNIELDGASEKLMDFGTRLTSSSTVLGYSVLSGTNTGYGFYSPNVKAGALVTVEVDGAEFEPHLKTHEGSHMFQVMTGAMTNGIIEDIEKPDSLGQKTLHREIEELMLKNIGVYALAKHGQQSPVGSAAVNYYILDLVALEDHVPGEPTTELVKVKTIALNKKPT